MIIRVRILTNIRQNAFNDTYSVYVNAEKLAEVKTLLLADEYAKIIRAAFKAVGMETV